VPPTICLAGGLDKPGTVRLILKWTTVHHVDTWIGEILKGETGSDDDVWSQVQTYRRDVLSVRMRTRKAKEIGPHL
jgi:hypothetical protein